MSRRSLRNNRRIRTVSLWNDSREWRIRYRESMGRIDPWSIPECVSLIQTFKTMFVMIADEHPVINDGDCLIFMQS